MLEAREVLWRIQDKHSRLAALLETAKCLDQVEVATARNLTEMQLDIGADSMEPNVIRRAALSRLNPACISSSAAGQAVAVATQVLHTCSWDWELTAAALKLLSSCFHLIALHNADVVVQTFSNFCIHHHARVREAAVTALLQVAISCSDSDKLGRVLEVASPLLLDVFEKVRLAAVHLLASLARQANHLLQVMEATPQSRLGTGHTEASTSIAVEGSRNLSQVLDDAFQLLCGCLLDISPRVRAEALRSMRGLHCASSHLKLQALRKKATLRLPATNPAEEVGGGHSRAGDKRQSTERGKGGSKGRDAQQGKAAERGLGLSPMDAAVGAFVHGTEDEHYEVRLASAQLLLDLSSHEPALAEQALEFLVDMLRDPYEEVRNQAARGLVQLVHSCCVTANQLNQILAGLREPSHFVHSAMYHCLEVADLTAGGLLQAALQGLITAVTQHPGDMPYAAGVVRAHCSRYPRQLGRLAPRMFTQKQLHHSRPQDLLAVLLGVHLLHATTHSASMPGPESPVLRPSQQPQTHDTSTASSALQTQGVRLATGDNVGKGDTAQGNIRMQGSLCGPCGNPTKPIKSPRNQLGGKSQLEAVGHLGFMDGSEDVEVRDAGSDAARREIGWGDGTDQGSTGVVGGSVADVAGPERWLPRWLPKESGMEVLSWLVEQHETWLPGELVAVCMEHQKATHSRSLHSHSIFPPTIPRMPAATLSVQSAHLDLMPLFLSSDPWNPTTLQSLSLLVQAAHEHTHQLPVAPADIATALDAWMQQPLSVRSSWEAMRKLVVAEGLLSGVALTLDTAAAAQAHYLRLQLHGMACITQLQTTIQQQQQQQQQQQTSCEHIEHPQAPHTHPQCATAVTHASEVPISSTRREGPQPGFAAPQQPGYLKVGAAQSEGAHSKPVGKHWGLYGLQSMPVWKFCDQDMSSLAGMLCNLASIMQHFFHSTDPQHKLNCRTLHWAAQAAKALLVLTAFEQAGQRKFSAFQQSGERMSSASQQWAEREIAAVQQRAKTGIAAVQQASGPITTSTSAVPYTEVLPFGPSDIREGKKSQSSDRSSPAREAPAKLCTEDVSCVLAAVRGIHELHALHCGSAQHGMELDGGDKPSSVTKSNTLRHPGQQPPQQCGSVTMGACGPGDAAYCYVQQLGHGWESPSSSFRNLPSFTPVGQHPSREVGAESPQRGLGGSGSHSSPRGLAAGLNDGVSLEAAVVRALHLLKRMDTQSKLCHPASWKLDNGLVLPSFVLSSLSPQLRVQCEAHVIQRSPASSTPLASPVQQPAAQDDGARAPTPVSGQAQAEAVVAEAQAEAASVPAHMAASMSAFESLQQVSWAEAADLLCDALLQAKLLPVHAALSDLTRTYFSLRVVPDSHEIGAPVGPVVIPSPRAGMQQLAPSSVSGSSRTGPTGAVAMQQQQQQQQGTQWSQQKRQQVQQQLRRHQQLLLQRQQQQQQRQVPGAQHAGLGSVEHPVTHVAGLPVWLSAEASVSHLLSMQGLQAHWHIQGGARQSSRVLGPKSFSTQLRTLVQEHDVKRKSVGLRATDFALRSPWLGLDQGVAKGCDFAVKAEVPTPPAGGLCVVTTSLVWQGDGCCVLLAPTVQCVLVAT